MEIYVGLYLLFSIVAFLDLTNIKKKNKAIIIIVLAIIVSFVSGIRWQTGTDWIPYYNYFMNNENIDDFLDNKYNFEAGYAILNYIIKVTLEGYNFLLFFITLIIVTLKYQTLYKYSLVPLIAIWINFSNFNGDLFPVRQYIAVAVNFFSIRYIVNRNFYKFVLCVSVASLFHMSAFFFLPAYKIYNLKMNSKVIIYSMIVSVLIGYSGIIESVTNSFLIMFTGVDLNLMVKLADYSAASLDNGDNSSKFTVLIGLLRKTLFIPVFLYCKSKIKKDNDIFGGLVNIYVYSVIFILMFSGILETVIGRLTIYYFCVESLLISSLFTFTNRLKVKMVLFLFLCIYCAAKLAWGFAAYPDEFIPYKSIL